MKFSSLSTAAYLLLSCRFGALARPMNEELHCGCISMPASKPVSFSTMQFASPPRQNDSCSIMGVRLQHWRDSDPYDFYRKIDGLIHFYGEPCLGHSCVRYVPEKLDAREPGEDRILGSGQIVCRRVAASNPVGFLFTQIFFLLWLFLAIIAIVCIADILETMISW